MRTVAEHLEAVLALVEPLPPVGTELEDALGAVLAQDVRADDALPHWDCSAMDGYAVRAGDLLGAGPSSPVRLRVVADLPAGSGAEPVLALGSAARIMTGAPIPAGADAVVPVEQSDGGVEHVVLTQAPALGAHIRRAGEDVRPGDLVLAAGTWLGPAQLAAAASVGAGRLQVHRRPRVAVLSTGAELVPPGRSLTYGQIHDSNSYLLAAAVREAGCDAVRVGAVPDDPAALAEALDAAEQQADLVVTSGGVSMGAYDVVKQLLAGRTGIDFVRVAMQPGKPQGLGRLRSGTPLLALPGNPVSAFVSFHMFVRPALRRLAGHRDAAPAVREALVEDAWRTPESRAQVMPVVLVDTAAGDGALRVRRAVEGGSGSHLVASLARAHGLAVVPAAVQDVRPGDRVEVLITAPELVPSSAGSPR
ncbi:molybdopterin molybdenumtransferase [Actinotalea ferrariae CF5-4]|uniref:Molybdopterin molybdenumtransferase n=1 Tax=Actinotalea ferrariae CF5-4 TaxID=948458 RepID=A0A021VW38_9CELL|nr:gephyrin-like molybdotransferase Glp [Actinotalea ferrariae]EYR63297.1 molybdopterin molybdenumtransferase [Actinotalea ferrariae CF5-4]